MEYGEYVKFIHSAIDWNNLTYILYPYFWSSPVNTDMAKLFLKHPDRLHQDFLRAGAARIILPIHTGYESEVAALLDQGRMGKLPAGHRYGPMLDQVHKAQADLAKLIDVAPPADDEPLDDESRPRGVLIGSWTEYTPTPALDLTVTSFEVEEEA
jgi:hypothetical protein